MFYIECIDATTQQLLLRLLTGCCNALRSTQLANTLPSLMLRSKISASFFQASTIIDATPYKIFSSISKLQLIFNFLLSLMLSSKIFSSSFQHQPFYSQRSSQLSNIVDATLSDTLFTFQTSSMLHSKISFVFSHILPALMLCFSILFPCFSHCTIIDATLRTSLQFSSMFDVTL